MMGDFVHLINLNYNISADVRLFVSYYFNFIRVILIQNILIINTF
jgi:hypothetical protein